MESTQKNWEGKLRGIGEISFIPLNHYHVLEINYRIKKGDSNKKIKHDHGMW